MLIFSSMSASSHYQVCGGSVTPGLNALSRKTAKAPRVSPVGEQVHRKVIRTLLVPWQTQWR